MTLVINNDNMSSEEILSRYGDNIFDRYHKLKIETEKIISDNSNEKLAIKVDLNIKIVKDKNEAKTNKFNNPNNKYNIEYYIDSSNFNLKDSYRLDYFLSKRI